MSTQTYTIRLATPEDISATLEMKLLAWRQTYTDQRPESFFNNAQARQELEADWWARGLAQGAELWIALDQDSNIVGVAGGGPVAEEDLGTGVGLELQVLYVLAEHYGSGLGAQLLETVLSGRDSLLWVLEGNARAIAFYKKHGFITDGRIESLADDWAGLREICMVRRGDSRG
ncbi:GNAT family N-acetyltransferase [Arthrobacter sp. MYb227]|uniref:GNAT family N-acetyltransferase n=1 Tax=Arthrobacter sp. MYb227 TaxID=1848601 RepID=UPI000CFC2D07|nr:GNAT family N-acetyltransferase [Arthrobacter sp. MYb227]PQZ89044.1 GNAT family N-acetyltransferase [Arthrobacter sp. MYb227]